MYLVTMAISSNCFFSVIWFMFEFRLEISTTMGVKYGNYID